MILPFKPAYLLFTVLMAVTAASSCKREEEVGDSPKLHVHGDPKGRDLYYVTTLSGKPQRWLTRSVTYLPSGGIEFINAEGKYPVIVSPPFKVEHGGKLGAGRE